MKTQKNKTIDFTAEEGAEYASRAITVTAPAPLPQVRNRMICGDTFQVLPFLPPECVDLLIADPPYNLDKDFHGGKFKKMSADAYEEYTESWLKPILPLLKKTASVYVCCDWQTSPAIYQVLKKYFIIRNRITWQREKGRGAMNNWKNGHEDIWFATCSKEYTFHVEAVKIRRRVVAPYREKGEPKDWEETPDGKFRNTCPSNFWDDISIPYWSMPENTAHPTQKPEKLLAKLILASSNPGNLILDPFAGSGSSAVTAKKLKRDHISIEQNIQYCAWAEKRLEMAEEDSAIQGYTNGVFWERNTSSLQKKAKK